MDTIKEIADRLVKGDQDWDIWKPPYIPCYITHEGKYVMVYPIALMDCRGTDIKWGMCAGC